MLSEGIVINLQIKLDYLASCKPPPSLTTPTEIIHHTPRSGGIQENIDGVEKAEKNYRGPGASMDIMNRGSQLTRKTRIIGRRESSMHNLMH